MYLSYYSTASNIRCPDIRKCPLGAIQDGSSCRTLWIVAAFEFFGCLTGIEMFANMMMTNNHNIFSDIWSEVIDVA